MKAQTCSISSSSWLLFCRILSRRFCFSSWNTHKDIHKKIKKRNMWMPVFTDSWALHDPLFTYNKSKKSALSPLLCPLFFSSACHKACLSLIAVRSDVTLPDAFRWLFKNTHTHTLSNEHKVYTCVNCMAKTAPVASFLIYDFMEVVKCTTAVLKSDWL